MDPTADVTSIADVIQLSVAPAFLLTGSGGDDRSAHQPARLRGRPKSRRSMQFSVVKFKGICEHFMNIWSSTKIMTAHHFGGGWTNEKLERLRRYLIAYSTALKKQSFRKLYIDAFAGTGYREVSEDISQLQFELPALSEVLKGSAPIAIEIEPSFDSFTFIERTRKHFEELQKLAGAYPGKRSRMTFLNEDANNALARICRETDWVRTRAVLFLDPYGNQVEWKTLEIVASTKAIDTWILFPVGMGVDRLLPRDGNVPVGWQNALDRLLGERNWRSVFYAAQSDDPNLFGESTAGVRKLATPQVVEKYFVERLKTIFAGVADRGLPLYNKKD